MEALGRSHVINEILLSALYAACVRWEWRQHVEPAEDHRQWFHVTHYMFWYREHFEVKYG